MHCDMVIGTYLVALLQEDLVVFAQSHAEDDGGDVFEAMDPLLSLAALTTDIEHAVHLISGVVTQQQPTSGMRTVYSIDPW